MCTTLAKAATPYGEILGEARRDDADFAQLGALQRQLVSSASMSAIVGLFAVRT